MFKQYFDSKDSKNPVFWEEIPDEDLWEDGELTVLDLMHKIEHKVLVEGSWILLRRRKDNDND